MGKLDGAVLHKQNRVKIGTTPLDSQEATRTIATWERPAAPRAIQAVTILVKVDTVDLCVIYMVPAVVHAVCIVLGWLPVLMA